MLVWFFIFYYVNEEFVWRRDSIRLNDSRIITLGCLFIHLKLEWFFVKCSLWIWINNLTNHFSIILRQRTSLPCHQPKKIYLLPIKLQNVFNCITIHKSRFFLINRTINSYHKIDIYLYNLDVLYFLKKWFNWLN